MKSRLAKLFEEYGVSIHDCVEAGMAYGTVYAHLHGTRDVKAESAVEYERAVHIPRHRIRPDLWEPHG